MEDIYTIQEVALLLNITTQAVYKRLQQDKESLEKELTAKGGKKSLTKDGVLTLADLMGLDNPFLKKNNGDKAPAPVNSAAEDSVDNIILNAESSTNELLSYLKEDNKRLLEEIQELKKELMETRAMREQDHRSAEDERRKHEEARMRSDALLMKAMMNQQQPGLLARIFRKKNKEETDSSEN